MKRSDWKKESKCAEFCIWHISNGHSCIGIEKVKKCGYWREYNPKLLKEQRQGKSLGEGWAEVGKHSNKIVRDTEYLLIHETKKGANRCINHVKSYLKIQPVLIVAKEGK